MRYLVILEYKELSIQEVQRELEAKKELSKNSWLSHPAGKNPRRSKKLL